jgi:hypothetical protein
MTALAEEVSETDWFNSSRFDIYAYLESFEEELLECRAGRIAITRTRPLLFALLYLPHLLKAPETGNVITWADTHLYFAAHGRSWIRDGGLRTDRHAFVAPRDSAKSTWLFKILPLWAASHKHKDFIVAFSSSGAQAEGHLKGFKNELDNNRLLREDYARLCAPAKRPSGVNVSDTQSSYFAKSGFTFTARGIDAENLGMVSTDNRRPQVIILDDVEPDETNYSVYQKQGRLLTITDAILPMNERAHVVLAGTVTMPGSIIHELVQSELEPSEDTPNWIGEEKFQVHYFAPIVGNPDGTRRSIWPAKWPLEYLESIEHTNGFAKNFANLPIAVDGDYWTPDDIKYGDVQATTAVLSIDPAVTKTKKSDFYGLSVIAYDARTRKCSVRWSREMKLSPGGLRDVVLRALEQFEEIGLVVIETNQGGDTWLEILHDLPVGIRTIWQGESKEARAARLLNRYQRGQVTHATKQPALERQMCAYPKVLNEDLIDSVGTGVHHFHMPRKRRVARSVSPG